MKLRTTQSIVSLLAFLFLVVTSQAQFWSEDFETDGEGTRYTTSVSFNDGTNDHFNRTDGSDISNVGGAYSAYSGTYFWAGEDLDDDGGDGNPTQIMTFSGIDITSLSSIEFRGLFGTGSPADGWDAADEIILEYQVDAGGYTSFMEFHANAASGSNIGLYHDANLDGVGETALGTALAEFTAVLSVSGTALDIRISCTANSASEEFAFDLLRLFDLISGTPGCIDTTACNYDSTATVSDGSCTYPGCDDSTAVNYDSSAGCTDGSCYYTLPNLVINEIHYNPHDANGYPDADYEFLEIYNADAQAWDLEGYSIAAVAFTFPSGASIAAGEYIIVALNSATYSGNGYQVFDCGNGLANGGELVEIIDPFSNLIDSVNYDSANPWPLYANGNGPTLALNNTGDDNSDSANWHWSDCVNYTNGSPGAANPGPLSGCTDPSASNYEPCAFLDDASCIIAINDIVINEIHYNPCTAQGTDADFEFVELYNQGNTTQDLENWTLTGFDYTFGAGASIAPCEYIIITSNAASYSGNGYQVFETVIPTALTNTGELVTLYDDLSNVIDAVEYGVSAPWPTDPNGNCPSLELVNPGYDNGDDANWQASFVDYGTPGAPNSTADFYSCTECGVGSLSNSLLNEDVEDADISTWTQSSGTSWYADNSAPINGTYSMSRFPQGIASNDYIAHDLGCYILDATCTTWRFQMNNSTWAPDANNRVWIWLVADNGDLSIANGYALTFDNNLTTNGELALVRMDNGAAGAVLNSTNYTWTAGSTVGFEVIHTETNTWYIKVDNDGGFDMLLTLSGCPTDNTYTTGTHMGIYFEYDATACDDLQFDDISMTQCGTPASYYSVDSGAASGAVWNTDPSAGIGNGYEVIFNPYKEAFITNSQTINLDTDVSMMNLQIGHGTYGTGTLNVSASEAIMLTGNWTNNANFSAANGSVIFKGTAATQSLGGTATSDFYNVEVNKEAGSVVQANTVTIRGALYPELGTYDINSQPFTLISDATGTGAIAEIKTGADVTGGTITLQRYIAPGSQQTWMNLGNGLMNTTISDWDNEITTTGFTGADYEYADYPFINIYHYDESTSGDLDQGFTAPVNTAEALDHQFGYLVYLETAAQNVDATGDFQKGDVTLNLNFTANNGLTDDGWNLVSNVYPSAISWTDVYNASSGIGSTYYVHDGDGFNGTRNYIFYDAVSGTGTASDVIASGQSFWVKVDGAGGTLNFNEASKTQAASLFERQLLELPVLGMKVTSASSSDYCYIVLDENMSHTFDSNRDALHLGGNSMNQSVGLSTQSADEMFLSVNNIPGFEDVTTIPVQFKSPVAQNLTFEITDWDEIPEGVCLVIEDLTSGEMTVLDQDTNFEFAAEAEDGIRFLIHVSGPAQMDISPLACYGDNNASITANAAGEGVYTYTWIDELDNVVATDENVESSTIENLAFGNYTVVITGENTLCPATSQSVYIDQPTQETAQADGLTAWCNEEGSGIITIETNADVYNYNILDANNTLILSETLVSGESMVAGLDGQVYSVELNSVCSAFTYTIDLADANAINAAIEPNVTTGVLIDGQAIVEFDANASNADNFAWTVNGTAVSGTDIMQYTFELAGVYTVAVIAENAACSAQHSIEFTVEEFNAVEENEDQIMVIQMADYLQLQGGAAMRGAMAYVYSTTGQLVKQERISDENATIYTADLTAGSYRMVVRNGQSELLNHAFVQGK